MPGRPAMFTVTVNTSLRYISTGSPDDFSPMPKAADGVAGAQHRVDADAKVLFEVTLDQRGTAARAGNRHRSSPPNAHRCRSSTRRRTSAPNPAPAGSSDRVGDVAAGNAQAVTITVVAGEVRGGFGWRHDIVAWQRGLRGSSEASIILGAGVLEPCGRPCSTTTRSPPACRRAGTPWGCRSACL